MVRHLRNGGNTCWTLDAHIQHNEALRKADRELSDVKINHLAEVIALNDRRYTNENELRAMALKIKETADANALELASEAQTYKESRNDAMREQSLKETGVYATRDDLASAIRDIRKVLQPVVDYVSSAQGAVANNQITRGVVFASISAAGVIIGLLISVSVFLTK